MVGNLIILLPKKQKNSETTKQTREREIKAFLEQNIYNILRKYKDLCKRRTKKRKMKQ